MNMEAKNARTEPQDMHHISLLLTHNSSSSEPESLAVDIPSVTIVRVSDTGEDDSSSIMMSLRLADETSKLNDLYNEGLRAARLGRWRQARQAYAQFVDSAIFIERFTPESALQVSAQLLEVGNYFCRTLFHLGAARSFQAAFCVLSSSKLDLDHKAIPCSSNGIDNAFDSSNGNRSKLILPSNKRKGGQFESRNETDLKKASPADTLNTSLTELSIEDEEVLTSMERMMAEAFRREVTCVLHLRTIDDLNPLITERSGHFRVDVKDADVCMTLGCIFLDVGQTQIDNLRVSSATDALEMAMRYFRTAGIKWIDTDSAVIGRLVGNLGYCYMCTKDQVGLGCPYLKRANVIWKRLGWPIEDTASILNSLKHTVEAELKTSKEPDDTDACSNLMKLYVGLKPLRQELKVAEAFVSLGAAAFQNTHEKRAVGYFEQALWMYRQASSAMETNRNEIVKVLRFIGISSYNCRNFHKAAKAYTECLSILKSTGIMSTTKMNQLAECYASLGFTFSRLRDFDEMLHFYEMALELQRNLAAEDLELIQTNVGSLYFVKAVKAEQAGDPKSANAFFQKAEASFNRAQRYSWKSFPFINFGYYLLCRERYTEAVQILSQGYQNGQVDKDTVEFDHTEDPILIEDLQFELEEREDIRMPSAILALYLQTLALTRMLDVSTAQQCVAHLHKEITCCDYGAYYVEGFGVDRMKALCYSLLGYAYRHLDCHVQALEAFSSAVRLLPTYTAANKNVESQKCYLAARSPNKVASATS